MSNGLFYAVFIVVSLIFYIPSLWFARMWSETSLTKLKFFVSVGYNCLCIFFLLKYAHTGFIPFFDERKDDVMGWFSFGLTFLYAYSIPVDWRGR